MELLICKPTDGLYDLKDKECQNCKANPKTVCKVFSELLKQDAEIVNKYIRKRQNDED